MVGACIISFLAGGFCGMLSVALLSYGSKTNMMRENGILKQRLEFLENVDPRRKYTKVKNPRTEVHKLVN